MGNKFETSVKTEHPVESNVDKFDTGNKWKVIRLKNRAENDL
jgi:hypothetical protein